MSGRLYPARRVMPVAGLLLLVGACAAGSADPDSDPPAVDPADEDGPPNPSTEVPSADGPPTGDPSANGESAATDDPGEDPDDAGGTSPDLSVALELTDVASMDAPTAGAVGPDGLLYLAERAGTVHPLTDEGLGDAVIDLSGETTTDGERGLLGLAFAADGGELYLSWTDLDGNTVVGGVALTPDGEVRPDERRTIFTLEQPYANHNGGNIAIGPDGMLFLGLGDGGGAGDPLGTGQDTSTPLGALLRIDPSGGDPYEVPPDNPFVDRDGAAPEIYAYGLRNPWRFSFDAATGLLYLADVGQNTREEINVVDLDQAAGANFGWSAMEGTLEFGGAEPDDHVPPVHEYETGGQQGCSITGGYVYRGAAIPELRGAYLYTDLCASDLNAIVVGEGEVVDEAVLDVGGEQVVSFAQDADGELYLLDFAGAVRRIDPA